MGGRSERVEEVIDGRVTGGGDGWVEEVDEMVGREEVERMVTWACGSRLRM